MPRYQILGLTVASQRPFPGFAAGSKDGAVDVQLVWVADLDPLPNQFRERGDPREASPTLSVTTDGEAYHFAYEDGTQFRISGDGRSVLAVIAPAQAIEDALTYFVGPILGFALALRGIICLHAGAVVIDDQAVAFIGAAGAGKSTTVALLSRLGVPVISDDTLPCRVREGVIYVQSSYPRVRLWEDSVTRLEGAPNALPLLTPNWDKRYLPLDAGGFANGLYPLRLLAFLGEEPSDRPLILRLASNTYIIDLLPDHTRSAHFTLMGKLAREVPAINLERPQNSQEYLAKLRNTLHATKNGTIG